MIFQTQVRVCSRWFNILFNKSELLTTNRRAFSLSIIVSYHFLWLVTLIWWRRVTYFTHLCSNSALTHTPFSLVDMQRGRKWEQNVTFRPFNAMKVSHELYNNKMCFYDNRRLEISRPYLLMAICYESEVLKCIKSHWL